MPEQDITIRAQRIAHERKKDFETLPPSQKKHLLAEAEAQLEQARTTRDQTERG